MNTARICIHLCQIELTNEITALQLDGAEPMNTCKLWTITVETTALPLIEAISLKRRAASPSAKYISSVARWEPPAAKRRVISQG